MVQDVKKRIGNPKELAQDELGENSFAEASEADTAEPHTDAHSGTRRTGETKKQKHRQLYRNMDERVIGGVCSGLGIYFGIDKVAFRIVFLILFIIGWFDGGNPLLAFAMLSYFVLWIAMPAAVTFEQKREMKGRPTNLKNYRNKDFDFGREVKDIAESPAGKTTVRATGLFMGILLIFFGLGTFLGSIFIPAVPQIIEHSTQGEWLSYADPDERIMYDMLTEGTFWGIIIVMMGILAVWFLYNGIMFSFNLKNPNWRPGLILFIAWIMSIFALAAYVIKTFADQLPMLV